MPNRLDLILGRLAPEGSDGAFLMQIAAKAREVRACQREYFKKRGTDALAKSKEAEGELDRLLSTEAAEASLFINGGTP